MRIPERKTFPRSPNVHFYVWCLSCSRYKRFVVKDTSISNAHSIIQKKRRNNDDLFCVLVFTFQMIFCLDRRYKNYGRYRCTLTRAHVIPNRCLDDDDQFLIVWLGLFKMPRSIRSWSFSRKGLDAETYFYCEIENDILYS